MSIFDKLKKLFVGRNISSLTETPIELPIEEGPKTIGDLQTEPLSAWGNDPIISGVEFHATMQLRTPLRVLIRHGELHSDRDAPPPKIVEQAWEGIWIFKTKTWEELGIDLKEAPESRHASDIGPVLPSQFLPFLIAVRGNLENDSLTVAEKMSRMTNLFDAPEYSEFITAYGGSERLLERLFPSVVESIDGVSVTVKKALIDGGYNTIDKIDQASDADLLSLKGIGRSSLLRLRAFSEGFAGDKLAERFASP